MKKGKAWKEVNMKKRTENGYFTVEAAMVLPVVLGMILFIIYMMMFQYNRCLLEQDMGAIALWGSRLEATHTEDLEEMVQERMDKLNRDKYVAWKFTALEASLERNRFSVRGAGHLVFSDGGENWQSAASHKFDRLSPVAFIRLCRRVQEAVSKDAEAGK